MKAVPGDPKPGSEAIDVTPILVAASRGDQDAWRRIVDLYARRVFALAQARMRNPEVAEEIAQSVFATLAVKLGAGGYVERGKFEPWLFRIASNRIRDELRRRQRHAVAQDPETIDRREGVRAARASEGSDTEQIERLRWAMGQLTEADREVIELRHHGQLSFQQLAESLDEPLGTLLARHHRALAKLRSILESADARRPSGVGREGRFEA
ncbi:MAG: sigma-70 family RNA polymerase sigma factor [Phycisphaerales bacterium]|nr:sigma-70 family RNA polymerase sigma factor [Planctomycetota bacterium]